MQQYDIRQSCPEDIDMIMNFISHSRQLMRVNGNMEQWTGGYPSRDIIANDISQGSSHLICRGGQPVAAFALVEGIEPTYAMIDGEWEEDERPYGTIHRLACAEGQDGIFDACLEYCRSQVTSLRIDTHKDNSIMLHLASTRGFKHCGVVYMEDGSPREAFQMLNTGLLCLPLQQYIKQNILPLYDTFDTAHRSDHANTVIEAGLSLAKHYNVEINMVYAIAAYHDIGLSEGREHHHTISARMMLSDVSLRRWFDDTQLDIMAKAIEDHRASSGHEPRSIYGKIVAEADRDIDPMRIIRRTIQYGLSNQPELNIEEQWRRTLKHLNEKYAEGGYLRLWLPESPNATKLEQLRALINDTVKLREIFDFYVK